MRHSIGSLVRRKVYLNINHNKDADHQRVRHGVYTNLVCLVIQNQINHGRRKNRLELEPLFFEDFPEAEEGEDVKEADYYIKQYQNPEYRIVDRSSVNAYSI
jgi:hypothetical protein